MSTELLQQAVDALMESDRDCDYPLIHALEAALQQQEAGSDALDARRYRWLTADHDNLEDRQRQRSILHNFDMKSYSAVSRDIDAAMLAATPSTPENQS